MKPKHPKRDHSAYNSTKQYRSKYLFLINNLRESGSDPAIAECLPLLTQLITPEETIEITKLIDQSEKSGANKRFMREPSDDFCDLLTNFHLTKARTLNAAKTQAAVYLLKYLRAEQAPRPDPLENPFIRYIAQQLGLSRSQQEIILFLAIIGSTNRLNWMQMGSTNVSDYVQILATISKIAKSEISQITGPQSILMRTGLVSEGSDCIAISDEALRAINGDLSIDDFQEQRFVNDAKTVYPIDSFEIASTEREIITSLLKSEDPCLLLFYGKPGSGKTELARTLAQVSGKKILLVPPLIEGSHESRLSRVHYTSYFAEDAVIIVDEADNIINTESHFMAMRSSALPSKSLFNTFLDQNKAKILWIVNDYNDIHESTLRRFHFKMRFDKLSLKQREQAMDLILKKHGQTHLKGERFIQETIRDEFITPGILDNVVKSYGRIQRLDSSLEAGAIIPRLIQSHRPEKRESHGLSANDEKYHLEIINTSGNPKQVIETAQIFFEQKRRPGGGLNFLLHGLPGTGKTEFVKHVARECGRDVLFKRGSDLLSMWLGATEQNIAEAFREADKRDAILLVDEADTFFQSRELAQRSWEISQTNEFLNQMENHGSLLFCCTNLIKRLDAASMRRFHFKLEFRAMLESKRTEFFADYFKELLEAEPSKRDLERALNKLTTLTPGDFRAVRQRYSYRPAASVTWQELVSELEGESSYKNESQNRVIGF